MSADQNEPCPVCDGEFISKAEMLEHFTQDHDQSEQSNAFSEAKESNSFDPGEYNFNLSSDAEKSVCRVCGEEYPTQFSMSNHMFDSHSDEQQRQAMIEEIKRIHEHLGNVPTTSDLCQLTTFGHSTYSNAFGSWTKAVEMAGYTPQRYKSDISKLEILGTLEDFIEDNSGTPKSHQFDEYAPFSVSVVMRKFGSWGSALKRMGEVPYTKSNEITRDDLISDIKRVGEIVGDSPTHAQYRKHGQYGTTTVRRRFGSWSNGLKVSGFDACDSNVIEVSSLVSDIQRVAEIVGETPTEGQYSKYGQYGSTTVERALGSWNDGLRKSGFEPNLVHDMNHDGAIYYGKNWMKQRQRALIRDNNQCRVTGKHSSEIDHCSVHVHHITPAREFGAHDSTIETYHSKMNSLENLICLSPTCHKKLERKFQNADPDLFAIQGKEYLGISS